MFSVSWRDEMIQIDLHIFFPNRWFNHDNQTWRLKKRVDIEGAIFMVFYVQWWIASMSNNDLSYSLGCPPAQ